jgi:dihydrolipoamide dehydrogenase
MTPEPQVIRKEFQMFDIPAIHPLDEYNELLVSNVHPHDWVNPKPAPKYNLVVIGAGTAGLISAIGTAGMGGKVALIEKHLMGGDCLNVGCVPSKCLISSSRIVAEIKRAAEFGTSVDGYKVDFPAVMERMRRLRSKISDNDSAKRYTEFGVDVFIGEGRFTSSNTVDVDGQTLKFSKAVIATGARAFAPPIQGLAGAGFLTNETVFSLTELPKHLAVVGGGPIGCELAQAFRRLGSEVTIIEMSKQFLTREDPDAAAILANSFKRDGIDIRLDSRVTLVEKAGTEKILHIETDGKKDTITVDQILVGAGRVPNVQGLGLERVGVNFDERQGVQVNDRLQTTNPKIFAAGDICSQYKFTHTADAAARIVLRNALFPFGRGKMSALTVPWCTYTDPEIAHVGLYEHDAKAKGIEIDTFSHGLEHNDRAIAEGQNEGFVKIHVKKGTGKILGATIVAAHAGEMISEISLAMVGKVGLGTIGNTIHPYPTQAEAIKAVGNAFSRSRFTPRIAGIFKKWLSWTR